MKSDIELIKEAIKGQMITIEYVIKRCKDILYNNNKDHPKELKEFFDNLFEKFKQYKESTLWLVGIKE